MNSVLAGLAAVLVGLALVTLIPPGPRRRFGPTTSTPAPARRALGPPAAGTALAIGVWVVVGGLGGMAVGVVAGLVGARIIASLDDGGRSRRSAELALQAPEVAEMLAACLASGATLERATAEVAAAVSEPSSTLLVAASAQLSLGAPAQQAWAPLGGDPATASIARAVVRSLDSGAPMADALAACAVELRDVRRATIAGLAGSVAVKSVGPLGLCFLPAFVLIGVVPLVAGLLTATIGRL